MTGTTIIDQLNDTQRKILLRTGEEFAPYPRAMGVLHINALRNRFKLIEAEDAQRAIWNYRLTVRGREVKAALRDQSDCADRTKKRIPILIEESGYLVGVIETPKNKDEPDWTLIAELLRALADKIEECNA